ncbi:SdrD B-like domain-containing protein [Hydrogenophaga sp. T2]|uniref:SdrD B-like domain-containing protein n=1 Tax=Hydrogenophaga sp. T2 TaxID=3132823 RepID=UPI003CF18A09
MPGLAHAPTRRSRRGRSATRSALGGTLGALMGLSAWGQAPPAPTPAPGGVVAQIQSLDRFQAEQERLRDQMRNRPAAYDDQFLQSDDEPALNADGQNPAAEPPGLRYWLVETRADWTTRKLSGQSPQHLTDTGLRLQYQQETLNHGEWHLSADLRRQSGDAALSGYGPYSFAARSPNGERLTARVLGFPVSPQAFADFGLGDIGSNVTDGLSRGQRLSLGSSTLRGASLRLFTEHTDLRAGWGERGQLEGGPYAGFEPTTGQLAWLGLTQRFERQRYASAQVNRLAGAQGWSGTGVRTPLDSTGIAAAIGQGYLVSDEGQHRVRLSWVASSTQMADTPRNASGLYLEGATQWGDFRHEGGTYRLRPGLRFGDQLLSQGAQGAYWRMDAYGTRLYWGMGLDLERSDDAALFGLQGRRSAGLSANWNQRIDRRSSWGGYLQMLRVRTPSGASDQNSSQASAHYQNRWFAWGDSRLRATLQRNQQLVVNAPAATGQQLEWEQDWLPADASASTTVRTTLGWARDQSAGQTDTYPTAGLDLRTSTDSGWDLSVLLRYTSRSSNLSTSRGLAGTVQGEKQLTPHWRLGASLLLNQASITLDPQANLPGAVTVSRSNERTAMVYLRYEGQRGRSFDDTPGARLGAGAGRVQGVVFFDDNRDGIQQAEEEGVPGVEVQLNGRQSATTDGRGRFEFPQVRTGAQRLGLRPESIPLPWGEGPQSRTVVDVPLRGTAIAPLGVVRTRP